ncbi:MAG TPA: SET domain-containing protein-lysine N-methyltransferase [Gammaproteobacteria bacterium]|jgi:SET domain-containing protein|nr:SET domain-containing protein-lysine N-methyltransferase [Gammaproteobacteria bacterium]
MKTTAELKKLFIVKNSSIHGKGLYARKSIKTGAYLGTYNGPETEDNGMHVLWVEEEDDYWIGRDGKNLLRYLNHSEDPCAEFDGFDLYAIRKIQPKEELTIHYGEDFDPDDLEV